MMKITLDKVRDYFYDRSSTEEEMQLQRWFADHADSPEAEQLLHELFSEVQVENPKQAQRAFEQFCTRIGQAPLHRNRIAMVVRWTQRVAAILILPLLITLGVLYAIQDHRLPEWSEVVVPCGERSQLELADGTKLWLNAGTRVTYPNRFEGKQRKIFIDGEIFAEVTADANHPFIISAGDVEVKVLGTKFNMRAYNTDSAVEVALVEGRVLFDVNALKCDEQVMMTSSDIVQYDRLSGQLERRSFQSQDYRSRAKGGGFYFFNESLTSIVTQLARSFNRKIIITDPRLEQAQFYALFNKDESLQQILDTFNTDGSLLIREQSGIIYLSLKP